MNILGVFARWVGDVIWGAMAPRRSRAAMLFLAATLVCAAFPMAASADPTPSQLVVTVTGSGSGVVTSDPAGVDCGGGADSTGHATCTFSFDPGVVSAVLTETPDPGNGFGGFSGDCVATTPTTCTVLLATGAEVTATFDAPPVLTVTAPAAGTDYAQASVPAAAFTCPDPGVTCSVTVDGGAPVSNGAPLPAAVGSHPFTVTATAPDGGSASQSGTYTVSPPPTASITAPQDGTSYNANAVPPAAFTCQNGANSTLQTCGATVDGQSVSQGGVMPDSPGPHTLTVIATDADGSPSQPVTATYTVYSPPTCSDVSATTNEGVAVVREPCSDPNATSLRYTIDSRPRHGTATHSGGALTYTPDAGFAGTDGLTYHATSADGDSTVHTVSITVLAPPTAQISAPAAGQVYTVGQSVPTRFSCADDAAGPGLRSCTDSGGAADGTGVLDTSSEGNQSYTVTATSRDGQTGTAAIDYTVVGKAPEVVIAAPVNNAAYLWTAIPAADFTCLPGAGSSVQSCKATVGGQTISDHQALPDGFGAHVLTITATDADGLSSTESVTYAATVSTASVPPVSILAPRQGASYRLGQAVAARYSCAASTPGPALKSCVGTVPAGDRVNTRTLGAHAFSVSATNDQGESTTETVRYKIVATTNRFVVLRLRATASGAARLALKLPGPGTVHVVATAWNTAAGASGRHLSYGTASAAPRRGGSLLLVVEPTAAGRALLKTRGARPVVALEVIYKPMGAHPRVVRPRPLHLA